MRRSALACIAFLCLIAFPGCSSPNPAYEQIFQDLFASIRRVADAMQSVRDLKSLKEAREVILKEAETVKDLSDQFSQLGKPNSASKEANKKHLGELIALDEEINQASKHYAQVVKTVPLSKADRLEYAQAPAIFSQALGQFGEVRSATEN